MKVEGLRVWGLKVWGLRVIGVWGLGVIGVWGLRVLPSIRSRLRHTNESENKIRPSRV